MRHKQLINDLSIFFMIFSFLVGTSVSVGTVLCIGHDGHVAIEYKSEHSDKYFPCHKTPGQHSDTSHQNLSTNLVNETSECVDIPMTESLIYQQNKIRFNTGFNAHNEIPYVAVNFNESYLKNSINAFIPLSPLIPPNETNQINTTVLLI